MNSQNRQFSGTSANQQDLAAAQSASPLAPESRRFPSSFWRDRLFEGGLFLSMTLYYLVGNTNISLLAPLNTLFPAQLLPFISLPFLILFIFLCWYRLPFAVALLPLSLPYYLLQKTVLPIGKGLNFSLVEITLAVCVAVALAQLLVKRGNWPYRISWSELRDRLGPFLLPLLVFFLAAALSITQAYNQTTAIRTFRQEIIGPFLYLGLILLCLRTRQDIMRLLLAFFGSGLVIALLGLTQYFLLRKAPALEAIYRVHTVYGSANSIGLFFDYALPIGLTLIMIGAAWKKRFLMLLLCLPLLAVLYLTNSRGAWIALAIASLALIALSIRNARILLLGGLITLILFSATLITYRTQIFDYVVGGHTNKEGYSTVTKRFYLWRSALDMINNRPWLGYGMDNWLCYYSRNTVCSTPDVHHYWIVKDPVTQQPTGLRDEPELSHPHNIFLHIWVSIGIFGLLAFASVLILFFWLFVRLLIALRSPPTAGHETKALLRWMTIGVGTAMVAAVIQGQGDSAFLEQDLAFCFWTLVAVLLQLRVLSGTAWKSQTGRFLQNS